MIVPCCLDVGYVLYTSIYDKTPDFTMYHEVEGGP
jgi:hypothetical protein